MREVSVTYSGRALRDLEADGWEITETFHAGGTATDWHEHETGHFCLVIAGALVDEGGDARRDCGPGTLLYFPGRVTHRDVFLESGARCLNLRPPRPETGTPGVTPESGEARVLQCEHSASWLAGRVYDRIRIAARPHASGELGDLLAADSFGRADTSRDPRWLAHARALIDEEWASDARLGTVAERVGISRYHLARTFRERLGCSVGEYVHRLRVTHARHLLLATEASLSEIAFTTGFADQSHFTRIFRRHIGTSPDRYRRAA